MGFPIALEYAAVPGCPSSIELRVMVVDRLGYDPFTDEAPKHVTLRITSRGATLVGRTEWRDATGKWAGDQSFRMASTECLRLTRTMGLALAVQLQLLADTRTDAASGAGATAEPAPAPEPSAVQPAPPPQRAEPPSNERRAAPDARGAPSGKPSATFALGAGAAIGFGMSSTPILLGRAFGVLAWPHLSLQLGPELSAKASVRRADGAGFSQQLLLVSAAGCWVLSHVNACLVLNAGAASMEGQDIDRPTSARVPVLETGVRLGLNQQLGSLVFLGAHVDGLTLLTRRTGSLDEIPVWTAPVLAAAVGFDVGLRFP